MPFTVVVHDLITMDTDAIVNAANTSLARGGGVCDAIFAAADGKKLEQACAEIGHCDTGSAVITPVEGLRARYVIHAVGPVWQGGRRGEKRLLRGAYQSALRLAEENGCTSVAFPLISAGIYGFPADAALETARSAVTDYLRETDSDLCVYLTLMDSALLKPKPALLRRVNAFLRETFGVSESKRSTGSARPRRADIETFRAPMTCCSMEMEEKLPDAPASVEPDGESPDEEADFCRTESAVEPCGNAAPLSHGSEASTQSERACWVWDAPAPAGAPNAGRKSLADTIVQLDESFSQRLVRYANEKGMSNKEIYTGANLTRQVFSKAIGGRNGYSPSKNTVLALCVGLRLNADEARDLLNAAGFSLSRSLIQDCVVEYFLDRGEYFISDINDILVHYGETPLGNTVERSAC